MFTQYMDTKKGCHYVLRSAKFAAEHKEAAANLDAHSVR